MMRRSVKCVICLHNGDIKQKKWKDSWETLDGSLGTVLEKLLGVRISGESSNRPSLAQTLSLCTDCGNVFSALSTLLALINETQRKIDEHLVTVGARVLNSQGGSSSPTLEETADDDLWDKTRRDILLYFENKGGEQEQGVGIITNVTSLDNIQPEDFYEIKEEPQDHDKTMNEYETVEYDDYENVTALSFSSVPNPKRSDVSEDSSLTFTNSLSRKKGKRCVVKQRKKATLVSKKHSRKPKRSISIQRRFGKSNPNNLKAREFQEHSGPDELSDSKQSNINRNLETSLLKQWNLFDSPQPRIVLVDVYKNAEIPPKLPVRPKRKRASRLRSSIFTALLQSDSEDEVSLMKKLKSEKEHDEDFQPALNDTDVRVSLLSDPDFSDSSLLKDEVKVKHKRQTTACKRRRRMTSAKPKQTGTRSSRKINTARKKKTKYEPLDPNDEYLSKLFLKRGGKYYNRMPVQTIDGYHPCVFAGCDFRTKIDEMDSLSSLRTLVKHFRSDHKENKNHRCSTCDVFFKSLPELQKHNKLDHPGLTSLPKVECDVCGKQLCKEGLYPHQWLHMNDEERKAAIASGRSNPSQSLSGFTNKKILDKTRFPCTFCDKTFPLKHYLKAHEEVHKTKEERQKYICETCGEVFTTKAGLNMHIKREHHPELLLAKWKYCKICDKRFLLRPALENHMRGSHGAEWIHQCTICQRKFPSMNGLRKHDIVHKPDFRPHTCQYCNVKPYRHAKNLYRHMKTTHPDKPIAYTESYMSKLKKPDLKNSTVVMTCKQMYPCLFPKCEKIFELPSRLKKHWNISHSSFQQPLSSSNHLQKHEHSELDVNVNTNSTVNLQEVETLSRVQLPSSHFNQTTEPNVDEIDRDVQQQYLVGVQY